MGIKRQLPLIIAALGVIAAGMPTGSATAAATGALDSTPSTAFMDPLGPGQRLQVTLRGTEPVTSIATRGAAAGPRAPAASFSPPSLERTLRDNPASARISATADPQSERHIGPRNPQTTGTQFLGAQASDSNNIPPDTMGAVGPNQFVVFLNGRIRTFNKSTGLADAALDQTTDSFFGIANTSDPRIRYDRFSGRWFLIMLTVPTGSPLTNRLLIAFSSGGVISNASSFTFASVNFGVHYPGCGMDYDTLGIDSKALYVGGNLLCGADLTHLMLAQTDGLVLSKSALLANAPTVFDFVLSGNGMCNSPGVNDGLYTPQGVDNYDPAATFGYFAGVSICFFGELALTQISNPGGGSPTAARAFLTTAQTNISAVVPAQGSTHPLDNVDSRLMNAELRNGHLWTAHHICVNSAGTAASTCGAGDRDAIRWYDIDVALPSLNQSGTVFDPAATNPRFYWMPSINVSGQGHVAMGSSVAGNMEHAEAATMGRLSTDSLGSMQATMVYQTSAFAYNLEPAPTKGFQRWGDFSYTSVDPNDDMTMWTVQEYANNTDSWGVEVARLLAPPPATPSATDGTTLSTNQCSQLIAVTGTSTSGSGFFDPGPGFPNHIQASSTGGVTVNYVNYIDPTHITVDVSTQGASAGTKNLTVTNPDGQSVTVTDFLTVGGASTQPDSQARKSQRQYTLSNSDGSSWTEIDPTLRVGCAPVADQYTLLTANADLFTANPGFNQDIGIFVSDNGGGDQLVAWKESGGFAGTFSPNAAYVQVQYHMLSGHTYVFKLEWKTNKPASGATIFAAAGPIGSQFSPTSLVAKTYPSGLTPNFAVSTVQYLLNNSDGASWTPIDNSNLRLTLTPGANSTAMVGGNADLFTANAGFNQDIGIFVQVDGTGPDILVAWKESGGFAGTFSPNAAFVKTTYPMQSGHTYVFRLEWKTNKSAPGSTIYAGAGPFGGLYSPTTLFAETFASGPNPYSAVSTQQYNLSTSDGSAWQEIDSNLRVTVTPGANTNSVLGANVDLWTANAGFNQDIAIFVSDNGGADNLLAWKESGGFAGTFSPNAAFVQGTFAMLASHTYVFKMEWKTNKPANGATIFAGAGPIGGFFSPTRLTAELST